MAQMIIISLITCILAWFFGCLVVMKYKYNQVKEFMHIKTFCKRNKILALLLFLILGILAAVIFHTYGWLWTKGLRYLVLMYGMLVIAYIDAKKHLIPNIILLVLMAFRWIFLILEIALYRYATVQLLSSAIGGMVIGFVFFLFAYLISKKGIGMGDVKLAAIIGFYTGAAILYAIMILALILCIIYSGVQMLRKKLTAKSFVPFGPFVAIGTVIAIFLGL